ncbi:MAG: hypothetical protein RLZZ369_678, partial [Pseudomonadota bacterium]
MNDAARTPHLHSADLAEAHHLDDAMAVASAALAAEAAHHGEAANDEAE